MEQLLLNDSGAKPRTAQIRPWIWEGVSLPLSVACTTAVLVILHRYDGKPIPDWPLLTLNGIVSILSAFAHAALMYPITQSISQCQWLWIWRRQRRVHDLEAYNSASRGPLGSLLMLLKPRLWHLSTFGALLTIVALAMQPFLQLLPAYVPRSTPSSNVASIGRSVGFLEGGSTEQAFSVPSVQALSAIYEGIFHDTVQETPVVCPTGNCTWPIFTSLGVCSQCVDLGNELVNISGSDESTIDPIWVLPNGHRMNGSNLFVIRNLQPEEMLVLQSLALYSLATVEFLFWPGLNFTGLPSPADIPKAFQCVIHHCVRTYNASMVDGKLTEDFINVWPTNSTTVDELRAAANLTGAPANNEVFPIYGLVSLQPPFGGSYPIELWAAGTIAGWFQEHLTTWILATETADNDVARGLNSSVVNHNDPGPMMDSIALSFTRYMRTKADAETHRGDALIQQTFVVVRWQWAILPVALLVLASAFMILTIAFSWRRDIPTWKSSIIPSLVYRLDDKIANDIARKGPILDRLEDEAKRQKVVVVPDGRSWRLQKHAPEDDVQL